MPTMVTLTIGIRRAVKVSSLSLSTTVTGPDKPSFVKCVSVVTEPRSRGENETNGVVGSAV